MKVMISLSAVPLSVARPFVKNWNKNGLGVRVIQRFLKKKDRNRYRLYLPIDAKLKPKIVPPDIITQQIESAGYKIEDYVTGIASTPDGKRKIRMGKILKGDALDRFSNDKDRQAFRDEYVCVISAHPYDIAGMSTGRRWDQTSCMRLGTPENNFDKGAYSGKLRGDIAEGTLVAYVIKPSDTNLEKPHARLLIKPFIKTGAKGKAFFKVESKVYGTPVPGFKETIEKWLRKVNKDAEQGYYTLPDGLYDDGVGLSHLNVDYDKVEDRVAFYDAHMKYMNESEWFKHDKRWLLPMFARAARNLESAFAMNSIVFAARDGLNPAFIAKCFDETASEELVNECAYLKPQYSDRLLDEVFKKSKKLSAFVQEEFVYEPDLFADDDWILNSAAFYDPRWLGKVNSISDVDLQPTARRFLNGTFAWTKELENSARLGSAKIAIMVAALSRVFASKELPTIRRLDMNIVRKLAKQSAKVSLKYSPITLSVLERGGWDRIIRNHESSGMLSGYQILVENDIEWLRNYPVWAINQSISVFPVFDKAVALKDQKVNEAIISQIYSSATQAMFASDEWTKKYLPFVQKMAKGDDLDFYTVTARKILAKAENA